MIPADQSSMFHDLSDIELKRHDGEVVLVSNGVVIGLDDLQAAAELLDAQETLDKLFDQFTHQYNNALAELNQDLRNTLDLFSFLNHTNIPAILDLSETLLELLSDTFPELNDHLNLLYRRMADLL